MLIVVRHGRTDANASGLLLGRLDPPLDELGRSPGRGAWPRRVGPVDRVISSPLQRTRETAAAFGATVEIDERWIELDYGELDGTAAGRRAGRGAGRRWRADPSLRPARRRVAAPSSATGCAAACRRPGRRERGQRATPSWSSPTCRRSRRRWPGRSASATRCRGGSSSPPPRSPGSAPRPRRRAALVQRDRPPRRLIATWQNRRHRWRLSSPGGPTSSWPRRAPTAALAGLLFVAMSINIKEIVAFPSLPTRAAETVIVLVGALVAASAALLPGLSTRGLGVLLLGITTVTWLMASTLEVRGVGTRQDGPALALSGSG